MITTESVSSNQFLDPPSPPIQPKKDMGKTNSISLNMGLPTKVKGRDVQYGYEFFSSQLEFKCQFYDFAPYILYSLMKFY